MYGLRQPSQLQHTLGTERLAERWEHEDILPPHRLDERRNQPSGQQRQHESQAGLYGESRPDVARTHALAHRRPELGAAVEGLRV